MKTRKVLLAMVALILVPVPSLAVDLCFNDSSGNQYVLGVPTQSLVGGRTIVLLNGAFLEAFNGKAYPALGNLYVAPDGSVRVGLTVFADAPSNIGILVNATMTSVASVGANFTAAGSGFYRSLQGVGGALTFQPVLSCAAITQ